MLGHPISMARELSRELLCGQPSRPGGRKRGAQKKYLRGRWVKIDPILSRLDPI